MDLLDGTSASARKIARTVSVHRSNNQGRDKKNKGKTTLRLLICGEKYCNDSVRLEVWNLEVYPYLASIPSQIKDAKRTTEDVGWGLHLLLVQRRLLNPVGIHPQTR